MKTAYAFVKVSKLISASFNPIERSSDKRIAKIRRSAKKHGILVPIYITNKNVVIDGHGRIAVAKQLGIKKLQAVVYYNLTKEQMATLYCEVNANRRNMLSLDWLQVYLSGGVVPEKPQQHITHILTAYGKKFLIQIAKRKLFGPSYAVRLETPASLIGVSTKNFPAFCFWVKKCRLFSDMTALRERNIALQRKLREQWNEFLRQ